ncbi:MAG: NosD protein [Actinobacteria bacterium]|nr:NosD protein [Actinomycetota bacterium]
MPGIRKARKIPVAAALPVFILIASVQFMYSRPVSAGVTETAGPDVREVRIGGKISGEVRLAGRVRVTEDLLVLPGAKLHVAPGTVVSFDRSESSKVDPEYFHGGTEMVVRGTMRAEGARFLFQGRSGGIVVDGGRAEFTDSVISGAEAGIAVLGGGAVTAAGALTVADCRVGVALFAGRLPAWAGKGEVSLEKNGVGAVRFPGAPPFPDTFLFRRSEEADVVAWDGRILSQRGDAPKPAPASGALRLGDTFIARSRELSGDVVVDGVIRVAPGSTLSIAPGSRIFFVFRDTDGDGIGESGIFLQGNLDARGTKERPIGFYPLDGAGPGRWDAINFMASDQGENVLENVEIAGAYRGLHAHFSRFRGKGIRISGCFRGIQFQESDVELSGVEVADSLSGLRCRDSDVRIDGLRLRDTVSGANFFRSRVKLSSPDLSRTGWYGIRLRESRVELSGGAVRESFVGVSVQEGTVVAERLSVEAGGLAGIALQEGDVKIDGATVSRCRLDGISATGAKAIVTGGTITEYGRYAVKLGGPAEMTLRGVELKSGRGAANPVYDGKVAPGLGVVRIE